MSQKILSYQGLPIGQQPETFLINLTDLWQASCGSSKQKPLVWLNLESTQKLLKDLAQFRPVVETKNEQGKLNTWGRQELALAYAHFLGDDCYQWALTNLNCENFRAKKIVEAYLQKQSQPQQVSRRALIAAGWTIPIVATVALNQAAMAQVSPGTPGTDDNLPSDGNTGGSSSGGGGGDDLESQAQSFIDEQRARCGPEDTFTSSQSFVETVNGETRGFRVFVSCDAGQFSFTRETIGGGG